ncbi:hypothetical protein BKH43_04370 [Helicobacter sp. 13S00401-1]|uniref:hypothetical protein n=1 Tax=Helicobacter sp. 13S00401-1 TaxID=1905758 RepID=UPI000BA5FE9B|nr:hypothetical protein [Helicobacter sp. 13S00401-1]PAF50336.1 hypothetical protein BKH43_04370 [Helicobacter sp. 13S00401-1]
MLDESSLCQAVKDELLKKCCIVKEDDEVLTDALNSVVIKYLQNVDLATLKNISATQKELDSLVDVLCAELISQLEELIRNYKSFMHDFGSTLIKQVVDTRENHSKIEEIDLDKLTPNC